MQTQHNKFLLTTSTILNILNFWQLLLFLQMLHTQLDRKTTSCSCC